MTESLTDQIQSFFDNDDVNNFKDRNYKKKFLDDIEEKTKGDRKSIDEIFRKILKKKLKDEKISEDEFVKKRTKKFSSKLDLKSDTKKVEVKDETVSSSDKEKKFPNSKNPKASDENTLPANFDFAPMGTSLNMFLGAIFDNMEDLTDREREDVGVCIDMAFGDYIRANDKARKAMGGMGLLGIYGRKIKTARAKTKEQKKLEKPSSPTDVEPVEPEPQFTQEEIDDAEKAREQFVKDYSSNVPQK